MHRRIDSSRMELFIKTSGKKSSRFDGLLRKLRLSCYGGLGCRDEGRRIALMCSPPLTHVRRPACYAAQKTALLAYAEKKARHLLPEGVDWVFNNFSLIVSRNCEAQKQHIDVLAPQYQFLLMVTDNSPGTLYAKFKGRINSAEALIKEYERNGTGG